MMKYLFAVCLTSFISFSYAQTGNTYVADLTSLRGIIQKLPSYKDQVKGNGLAAYRQLFESLKADSMHATDSYRYFYNLARLFFPIRDNHLAFYQVADKQALSSYPVFEGNIDSLAAVLKAMPLDSISGVYFYDTCYSVGVFKSSAGEYTGVVLQSATPIWKKGEIALQLFEQEPGRFKALYAHPKKKNFYYYPVEKYLDYTLANSYFYASLSEKTYMKLPNRASHVNLPRGGPDFVFKELSPGIQYLFIRHFSANPAAMQQSQVFYDSIKSMLSAPSLVLDLRNNNGGANKVSKKFLSLLKKYTRKGKLYVLANNGTMSQGEIFILQLKQLKNVTIIGQTTRGMLAYGSNYGKRERVASGLFEVYVTDMRPSKLLIPYENIGVDPDIILANDKDWIEQTTRLIKTGSIN